MIFLIPAAKPGNDNLHWNTITGQLPCQTRQSHYLLPHTVYHVASEDHEDHVGEPGCEPRGHNLFLAKSKAYVDEDVVGEEKADGKSHAKKGAFTPRLCTERNAEQSDNEARPWHGQAAVEVDGDSRYGVFRKVSMCVEKLE